MNNPADFYRALRTEHPAATPATAYQLFMRDAKGCHIYREAHGAWCMGANPDRLETSGGTTHIPNTDHDEAHAWAARFNRENPVLGPERAWYHNGRELDPAFFGDYADA